MHIWNIPSDTTSILNAYLKHSIRYSKYIKCISKTCIFKTFPAKWSSQLGYYENLKPVCLEVHVSYEERWPPCTQSVGPIEPIGPHWKSNLWLYMWPMAKTAMTLWKESFQRRTVPPGRAQPWLPFCHGSHCTLHTILQWLRHFSMPGPQQWKSETAISKTCILNAFHAYLKHSIRYNKYIKYIFGTFHQIQQVY